jgi:hypothetical protein
MSTYQTGDGWTCPKCGQYVWWNQGHSCGISPTYYGTGYSTIAPDYSEQLKRIIELLEKLLEQMENK